MHDLSLARRMRALLLIEGGFTVDHRTGRSVDVGLAVGAEPARTLTFPLVRWSEEEVVPWLRDARAVLDTRPGTVMPSWGCAPGRAAESTLFPHHRQLGTPTRSTARELAPDRALGGWRRAGRVWLDIVRVVPAGREHHACALARTHGQLALYDLGHRALVPVEGS